jgi:uncharacterized membrane protein YkoI
VTKVEPELEHGRAVYEVEVLVGAVEHDLQVDQRDGAVLRHRVDTRGEHGRGHDD